jgi:hypothetical protein
VTLNGTGTVLKSEVMYGDDTGHLHIGPGHTFILTKVLSYSIYKNNLAEIGDAHIKCR